MSNNAIRLSPSGPVIQNANGGTMVPGPGARLRLVEASCTIGGSLAISTVPQVIGPQLGNGLTLSLPLPLPQAGLEYRVTALIDVFNLSTNVTGSCELFIDTSPDNVTWTEQASNSHFVGFSGGRQVRCDMKLKAGSLIGVTAGATGLNVRARIGASAGNPNILAESASTPGSAATSVGSFLLQLEECL